MLTDHQKARAARFRPADVRALIYNPQVRPHWIGDTDSFWYRRESPDGITITRVDAATGTATPAFDHDRLLEALPLDPVSLPLDNLAITPDGTAHFTSGTDAWTWSDTAGLQPATPPPALRPGEVRSPDGRLAAFARDHDLWLRDLATSAERRLTINGTAHHAYAKSPDMNLTTITLARRGITLPAVVLWSPDSSRLLTSRLDERAVLPLPLVQHVPPTGQRPILHELRVALPGDPALPMEQLLVIDLSDGSIATGPSIIAGVMTCIEREEAWWTADGTTVHFLDHDRHNQRLTLAALDASTGTTREIFTERAKTFVEVNLSVTGLPNIRILDATGEFVWFSQSTGHAHLALHDLATGALKHPITTGPWVVRDLLHVDPEARTLLFLAAGIDPAASPYHCVLCQAPLDGGDLRVLTPEPGDHSVAAPAKRVPRDHIRPAADPGWFLSPSGRYVIDTCGTLETPPISRLRPIDGSVITILETATLDPRLAQAWRWPTEFTLTAANETTTLHGALWLPTDFDPSKKYPVIDYIYPGPQRGMTPTTMLADTPGDLFRACLPQMFAELGFVVLNVDGRGTPLRGKAFHDESYGHLDDPGMMADHLAALRQLGERHPFIDLSRVGIMGHSGGGYASVHALLEYPETFHAAVATSGNHDNRGYSFSWTEKYMGELIRHADGTSNYDTAANPPRAHKLQGKLLLATGDMDDNVHPALTLQLAAALIEADRDFDLIVLPNDDHTTVWHNPYFLRRAMDFMVTHLKAAAPSST